jgi:hypothetical protein
MRIFGWIRYAIFSYIDLSIKLVELVSIIERVSNESLVAMCSIYDFWMQRKI